MGRVHAFIALLTVAIALLAVAAAWLIAEPVRPAEDTPAADEARAQMVELIQARGLPSTSDALKSRLSPRVTDAMQRVLRHAFVPERLRRFAYADRPLPIGYGQTISQPYMVAFMSDLLGLSDGDAVLEVGTGSGYHAAVLAEMGARVFTIEIIPELGRAAAQTLRRLGYEDVATRIADGYFGWAHHGPFDGIVVTAAATHIPPPLIQQLKPGGRMVIPVGPPFVVQQLMLVVKSEDGTVQTRQLFPVQFVPLTRE